MVEQLKIGMDKRQVTFIMGTPLIKDPFNHERWDYVYLRVAKQQEKELYRLYLLFNNDKLTKIETVGGPFPEGRKIK